MQPRFAALLFALGLADLAYVNLGLGRELFGDGAAGEAASASPAPPPRNGAAPGATPPGVARTRSPAPPVAPAATAESPPGEPAANDPLGSSGGSPRAEPELASAPGVEHTPPAVGSAERLGAAAQVEPAPSVDAARRREPSRASESDHASPRPALGADRAPAAPVAGASALLDTEMTVAFPDKGSAWLNSRARAQLLELAAKLRANPEYRVHIVGHADARGTREYNHDLGSRRARAVCDLLAKAGVSRDQLELASRGEDQPRALGVSERVWAANRRVEITIGSERTESQ